MVSQEIHKYIATETDKVISFVKSQRCLLNNIIEPYPDNAGFLIENFAVYHYWSDSEPINIFNVIGTAHPDYIGLPWIDMLKAGKRMATINLPLLAENPRYYFEQTKKEPSMHFTKIDDRLYISGEGNHRTAIAKVLFFYTGNHIFHGVEYSEFSIDHQAVELFENIKRKLLERRMPIEIQVKRVNTKREDTAGWKKDYYNISFIFTNHKTNKTLILDKNDSMVFLEELNSGTSLIKRMFSKGKYKAFLHK